MSKWSRNVPLSNLCCSDDKTHIFRRIPAQKHKKQPKRCCNTLAGRKPALSCLCPAGLSAQCQRVRSRGTNTEALLRPSSSAAPQSVVPSQKSQTSAVHTSPTPLLSPRSEGREKVRVFDTRHQRGKSQVRSRK